MSLADLTAAIPDHLPLGLSYNDLGTKFEPIQRKRQVRVQPNSVNSFSPDGARVIRFSLTSDDWMIPSTFRVQFKFAVKDHPFAPLGPANFLWSRIRVMAHGQLLSDESYADRLAALHCATLSPQQYAALSAESFQVTAMNMDSVITHETVPVDTNVRIQTPLITTPILNQKRWIPLRWMPLVIELELNSSYTSMCTTDVGNPKMGN
jgi:hypothetical protein